MDLTQDRRVAVTAAAVYVPLTLAAAALFAVAAGLQGRIGPATVAAGAFWVGLLTLIVLMPIVIPAVRRRRAVAVAGGAIAAALLLAACGTTSSQGAASPPGDPSERQTITVKASEFAFSEPTIRVRVGVPVRLVMDNGGVIEHDLRIAKVPAKDVHLNEQDSHGHAAKAEVATHSAAGKQSWVDFTPTQKGTYDVECTIAGHKDAGMKGKLIVE